MLACVTNLTQLSVEDNELASLAGIEPLVNLMELYAGERLLQLTCTQTDIQTVLPSLLLADRCPHTPSVCLCMLVNDEHILLVLVCTL